MTYRTNVTQKATEKSSERMAAGERLARSNYFAAGMKLLAEQGPAALTTVNICERLHVTRGSFYHHFASASAFHAALIGHWESDLYARAAEVRAQFDLSAQLQALKTLAAQHKAERAIRVWAYEDPNVAAAQQRVDEFRRTCVAAVYREAGVDATRADALALVGIALLAGTQMMDGLDRTQRSTIVDTFNAWRDEVLTPDPPG